MARKKAPPVNKSQAIRDHLIANPDSRPKDVVEALAAKGITVQPSAVSNVKTKMSQPVRSTSKRGKGAASKRSVGDDAVLSAKKFAAEVGSIEAAKEALDRLGKYQI